MQLSTLSQLNLFAEVARQGGVAAGGRALGLTATAAEDNLRALEARLGHVLIDVDGGAIRLTPAGERTLEALDLLGDALDRPGLARPADAVDSVPQAATAPSMIRLTLGANPPIFGHLRERLAAFEDSHEDVGIDLDLDCFTAAAAQRKIAAGMVDIAYYYALPGATSEGPANSSYAWTERLSLFVGADHQLAERDLVTREELALTAPLLLAEANPLRPLIVALMDMAGVGAAPPACESDDYGLLLDKVRAGEGFLALFGPLAQQFGAMEGVKRLAYAEMLPALDVRRAVAPEHTPAVLLLAVSLN